MSNFTAVPLFGENDGADRERMNAIIQNLNSLNEARVGVRYRAYGETRTENLKIACGAIDSSEPTRRYRNRWISAGSFFSPGTRPVAVASLATLRCRRSTISIAQRTGNSPVLDHTGFQCYTRWVPEAFNAPFGPNYINWIMMGF